MKIETRNGNYHKWNGKFRWMVNSRDEISDMAIKLEQTNSTKSMHVDI